MGKAFESAERVLDLLGIAGDDWQLDIITDPYQDGGDCAIFATKGTAQFVVQFAAGHPTLITAHDHASEEEAQRCQADGIAEVSHDMAEFYALQGEPTVALSQIPTYPGMYI